MTYSVHAVSDVSGSANSSGPGSANGAPGYASGTFNVGQTIRVTMKAVNTSTSTGAWAMINVRHAATATTKYRSPGGTVTALPAGAVGNSTDSPLGLGETDYYSFDIDTTSWTTGAYDISGTFRPSSSSNTIIDSTVSGSNTTDTSNPDWWRLSQFTLQSPQPLAVPSLSVSGLSGTTATLNWSWNGGQLNASRVELGLVRTNGLNGTSLETLIYGSSQTGTLPVSQTSASLHALTGNALEPGAFYRANIAYIPGAGFSGGGSASFAFQTTPLTTPGSLSRTAFDDKMAFGWGTVSTANGYRLQVKKAGASWPAEDAAPATSNVPVNILLNGNGLTWFDWNAAPAINAEVSAGPISGQAYEWRVKSFYSGTVFSAFAEGQSFTFTGNGVPTVNIASLQLQSDGSLVVTFTASDDLSSSLSVDLYVSQTGGAGNPGSYNFASKRSTSATSGVARTFTYSAAELASFCTSGGQYSVRVNAFDGGSPQKEGIAYSSNFTYSNAPVINNLTATASPGSVSVSFTPTDAEGESMRYVLQVYKGTGSGMLLHTFGTSEVLSNINTILQSHPNLQLTSIHPPLVSGTTYGLRVSLYDSAGRVDVDEVGFDYQAPPSVTVTGVNIGPYASAPAGSLIELTYTVVATAPTAVHTTAGLAYVAHPQSSPFIGLLPPAEHSPTFVPGNTPTACTVQATIPCGTLPGTYYLRSGLWFDRNGNGEIESAASPPDGDMPPLEVKTWKTPTTPADVPITVTAAIPPALDIVAPQGAEVTESGAFGYITVKRVPSATGTVIMDCAVTAKIRIDTTVSGSATPSTSASGFVPASADYIMTDPGSGAVISNTASVTIPPNQESVRLQIQPHDDVLAEGVETIRVMLDADPAYLGSGMVEVYIRETRWEFNLSAPTTLWSGKKTGGAFVFPITISSTPAGDGTSRKIRRVYLQAPAASGQTPQVFAQAHLDSTQTAVDLTEIQWRTITGVGYPIASWSDLQLTPGTSYAMQFSAEIAPAEGDPADAPVLYQFSPTFTVTYQNSFTGTVTTPQTGPLFKPEKMVSFAATSTGGTGTASYQWFGSEVPAGSTGSSLTFPLNSYGLSPILTRHADGNNNVWWSQTFVSLARTSSRGDASSDPSRRLAIQGVDTASGNLFMRFSDLAVQAIGVPFQLIRYYNSGVSIDASDTWSWNYTHAALTIDGFLSQGQNGRTVSVDLGDRTKQEFVLDKDGVYVPHTPGNFSKLIEDPTTGMFRLLEKNGLIHEFGFTGGSHNQLTHYYDKRQLLSIKTHLGQGLTFHYQPVPGAANGERRLAYVLDATGRRYDFGYDGSNRLQFVSDFTNRGVVYYYDTGSPRPDRVRDVRGKVTQFNYHPTGTAAAGRLHSILQPAGNTPIAEVTYYSGTRRVAGIRDGRGNLTAFEYQEDATNVFMPDRDEDFRVEYDPATRAISRLIESYNKPGQFIRNTDFQQAAAYRNTAVTGLVSATSQNVPGLLDSAGGPLSAQSSSAAYNSYGTPTAITDSLGFNTVTTPVVNPETNISLPSTVSTSVSTGAAKTWSYDWDTGSGLLNSITNPENQQVATYTYDGKGLLKTSRDGETNMTQYFYTLHGYPDRIIDAAGNEIDFETDPLGRVTKVTDQMGRSISYAYNGAGQVEQVTLDGLVPGSGESKTMFMTYDDNGRLQSRTDRRGAVTEFRYNTVNLVGEIILPATDAAPGRRNILLGYDSMNRPQTLENLNGHTTTRTYDNRGRLHTIVNGENQTILTRTYLDNGLVNTETDGAGATTQFTWDANQRLLRRTVLGDPGTTADDVVVEYPLYDQEGNVLTVRDPRGFYTHRAYDRAGRLVQSTVVKQGRPVDRSSALIDMANFHQSFTFDRNSQMKTFKDPEGHITTFFYDVMRRLDNYTDAAGRTWDYTYYANSLPHTVTTPDNRVTTFTFDAANRIDRIDYPNAVFADFGLDANGNPLTVVDQHGITSRVFDSRNQLKFCTDTFNQQVRYEYFPGGNLKNLVYPGEHTVAYTWDAAERLKTVTPWIGGTWTYAYRANSQIDLITHNNGTITDYGFDALGRLTDLWHKTSTGSMIARQQFTALDKSGNPEVENYTTAPGFPPLPEPPAIASATYDSANRLQTVNGSAATVDAGGRTTLTPAPSAASFTWEGPDWLKTFTQDGITHSFKTDGAGDRIERSISGPGAQTTRFTLDRSGPLANVLAETDSSNSPRRYYIHGLGLLGSIDAATNQVSTYHFDHRGDTLALTNASGSITDSYAYSVLGSHAVNGTTPNPFRFAGREGTQTDFQALLYMREFYYQPMLGLSLSQRGQGVEMRDENLVEQQALPQGAMLGLSTQPHRFGVAPKSLTSSPGRTAEMRAGIAFPSLGSNNSDVYVSSSVSRTPGRLTASFGDLKKIADNAVGVGSFISEMSGHTLFPGKHGGDIGILYSAVSGGYDITEAYSDTRSNWNKRSLLENATALLGLTHQTLETSSSVGTQLYLRGAPGASALTSFALEEVPELVIDAGSFVSRRIADSEWGRQKQREWAEANTRERWNQWLLENAGFLFARPE